MISLLSTPTSTSTSVSAQPQTELCSVPEMYSRIIDTLKLPMLNDVIETTSRDGRRAATWAVPSKCLSFGGELLPAKEALDGVLDRMRQFEDASVDIESGEHHFEHHPQAESPSGRILRDAANVLASMDRVRLSNDAAETLQMIFEARRKEYYDMDTEKLPPYVTRYGFEKSYLKLRSRSPFVPDQREYPGDPTTLRADEIIYAAFQDLATIIRWEEEHSSSQSSRFWPSIMLRSAAESLGLIQKRDKAEPMLPSRLAFMRRHEEAMEGNVAESSAVTEQGVAAEIADERYRLFRV